MRLIYVFPIATIILLWSLWIGQQSRSESAPGGTEAQAKVTSTEPLPSFARTVVARCRAKGSDARLRSIADQAARIAEATFPKREHQEAFLLMVCIESRFDNSVRSKVGAIGYTQIMPDLAKAFAEECKMGNLDVSDLSDGEINLTLGACIFKGLLFNVDGNVALALSGYNSGPNSPTTKKLSKLVPGNQETMSYIALFYQLKESIK